MKEGYFIVSLELENKQGLIAGDGFLPVELAKNAKENGFEVICIALSSDNRNELKKYCSKVYDLAPGELLKIKGATNEKITDISASEFSAVSHTNIQNLFISAATLHAIAKIAYEWHCFINDIESFDSQKYSDIVSYILNPESQEHPVELVIDAF